MAISRTEHVITVGTNKFVVELPDYYENIGDIVGIKKITADTDTTGALPGTEEGLKRYGYLTQLRCGCGLDTIKGRKLKYHQIVCVTSDLVTATAQLKGKNLPNLTNGDIRTVGFKRKKYLH